MKSMLFCLLTIVSLATCAQEDKSKRASPPAPLLKETLKSGATVSIDYSQPSLKGRTIGKDVEPMNGKVWRAGANDATVFETDKDVKIEGQKLPAGKYALYMLLNDKEWTIIFNKNWKQWGTDYEKNKDQDILHVKVPAKKAATSTEKLTYTIDKNGKVTLLWGDTEVDFKVE
jgi:Protein of unknown function (DUF2911)